MNDLERRDRRLDGIFVFVVGCLLLLCLLFLAGCTNGSGARRVLTENGFTNITITGYAAFMCGRDDDFATGFEATNQAGKRVKGAVCGGLFKGSTIRFK